MCCHLYSNLKYIKSQPDACPTKEISIKIQIKSICLYLLSYRSNHQEIFHIPRQYSCLGMLKIFWWLDQFSFNYKEDKFNLFPNLIILALVGPAPEIIMVFLKHGRTVKQPSHMTTHHANNGQLDTLQCTQTNMSCMKLWENFDCTLPDIWSLGQWYQTISTWSFWSLIRWTSQQ